MAARLSDVFLMSWGSNKTPLFGAWVEEWKLPLREGTHQQAGANPFVRRNSASTFYHPDFTVGPGVSPDRGKNSDKWHLTSGKQG